MIIPLVMLAYLTINYKKLSLTLDKNILELSIIVLSAIYILTGFFAVNRRDGIQGALLYFALLLTFYGFKAFIKDAKKLLILLSLLSLAGFGLSIIGIGSHLSLIGRFEDAVLHGRISSTFQYPNTLANFLTVSMVTSLGIILSNIHWAFKVMLSVMANNMFLTFIATLSRGGYLTLLVTGVIGFILLPKKYKFESILWTGAIIIPPLIAMNGYIANAYISNYISSLRWITGSIFLTVIGASAILCFTKIKVKSKELILSLILTAVIILAAANFRDTVTVAVNRLLPQTLVERVEDINLETSSSVYRLEFIKDGLKIVKDYPLIGAGSGGWKALFFKYQDFYYIARETHSHPIQLWVESGTLGFISFGAIWVGFLLLSFKLWSNLRESERILLWALIISAIAIGIHSTIDFNLSFGSFMLVIWSLFGSLAGMYRFGKKWTINKWGNIAIMIAIIPVVVFTASLSKGITMGEKGFQALSEREYEKAQTYYKEAIRFDKYNSNHYWELSIVQRTMGNKDEGIDTIKKGITFNKFQPELNYALIQYLVADGRLNEAYEKSLWLLNIQPYKQDNYEVLGQINRELVIHNLAEGNIGDIEALQRQYSEIIMDFQARLQHISALPVSVSSYRQLRKTSILELDLGFYYLTEKDYDLAIQHLKEASKDRNMVMETDIWLYLAYELKEDTKGMEGLKGRPWINFVSFNNKYRLMKDFLSTDLH
jgi:tetratricopeptide (TPR) repeat protein